MWRVQRMMIRGRGAQHKQGLFACISKSIWLDALRDGRMKKCLTNTRDKCERIHSLHGDDRNRAVRAARRDQDDVPRSTCLEHSPYASPGVCWASRRRVEQPSGRRPRDGCRSGVPTSRPRAPRDAPRNAANLSCFSMKLIRHGAPVLKLPAPQTSFTQQAKALK